MTSEADLEQALDQLEALTARVKDVQGIGISEDDEGPYLAVYVDRIQPHHGQLPSAIKPVKSAGEDAAIPVRTVEIGRLEPL